jgi:hypothetical protein
VAGFVAVAIAVFAFWSSRVNRHLRSLETELSQAKENDASIAQRRLETDLARQQERAANAESELLRLKEITRPRALTDDQLSVLSTALSSISDKFPIEIVTRPRNAPAMDATELCAEQLAKLFKGAGWQVSLRQEPGDVIDVGFRINYFMKESPRPPGVTTLMETFGRIGRHTVKTMENVDPKNELKAIITIGVDPRLY